MSNPSNNERSFIDEIWRKARYLEYLKTEKEKKNNKITLLMIKKRKFKSLLTFGLGLVLLTIATLLVTGTFGGNLALASIGIYMMSFALYYEYNFN